MPERQLTTVLTTVFVWIAWALLVILWTPVLFLVFLATAWWDPGRRIVGRVFRSCARACIAVNPLWDVRFEGTLPERGPCVVVCNHESLADVVLVGALPREMKWLSKRAVFRIPLLGWMMRMAGDIEVRRGERESRSRAYDDMVEWLGRGMPVMIFPEGTRSPTRELLPFKNGAFRLAIETGVPVLPLAVAGTRSAIRKGSLLFGQSHAVVRILEPIPVDGLGMEDVESLRRRVRDTIDAERRRLWEEVGV